MAIAWGISTITEISLSDLIPHLDRRELFQFHWGLSKKSHFAEQTLDQLIQQELEHPYIQPRAIYGIFACEVDQESLIVYPDDKSQDRLTEFTFPRQKRGAKHCITDFYKPTFPETRSPIAFQIVTIGQPSSDHEQELFAQSQYQQYLFRYGFHVALTEASAEYLHAHIYHEIYPSQKKEGKRFSFGYSCCPDLTQQTKLLQLLNASEIGISETESSELVPIHSTAALVCFNKAARYFHIA